MKFLLSALTLLLTALTLRAQPQATSVTSRMEAFHQRLVNKKQSLLSSLEPASIGPSIFSCRVTDVDVNPADPTEFYVAYASGGLWYSNNNGTSLSPVFDHEAAMTIGDIAVNWQTGTIWVGTGESNSSRSSYAGTGVYKSTDKGKSWTCLGLPESHHIGRIVLHPTDPNTIWVAVLGHLYSSNKERGIYKSTDGGVHWTQTLFVSDVAGAVDLCLDPLDPSILYAATWERERKSWDFKGAGEGSGIWKSSDGGVYWSRLNTPDSGFPTGKNTGRIGICTGKKDGKTILYASVDNQNPKPKEKKETDEGLKKDVFRTIVKADFLELDNEKLNDFLKSNGFPEKYNADKVKELVRKDKIAPKSLVEFLEDANSSLFEADYIGAEVYRSEDGGQHWTRTHAEPLNGINFTYGYYFSTVYCNPENADQVYLLGFLIIKSEDGGKKWKSINGDNVHVDHHSLWINPARNGHLINGNDGGLNISWDNGASWMKANNPAVGQFYAIAVDSDKPYNVYGGAQDNGVWVGPSTYKASNSWHQDGDYPYKSLLGGDGMQIAVDTRDNNTIYTGFQFGNYFRINKRTGQQKFITPRHDLGERPPRCNWQTPILLSTHNQDIIYFGAEKLYRSFDQGEHWDAISGDLTAGGAKGNVPYGTLSSITESPLRFGLLYTGSDDGLVQVSRDGGEHWKIISDSLPQKLWVSRVIASGHEKGRVYATLNGYRWDDFNAYVFQSNDYGETWKAIGKDLPSEPVNVIREDPVNPDVLYLGTDHGLYVSLDQGQHFQWLGDSFPAVPVHDLAVQKDAGDLVIGTHGRSLYKVNVSSIQQLTPEVVAETIHIFEIPKRKYSSRWGSVPDWRDPFTPELPIMFYSSSDTTLAWTVKTKEGLLLNEGTIKAKAGVNVFQYDLSFDEKHLNKYQKSLESDNKKDKNAIALKKAQNGRCYLYKGSHIFELSAGKDTAEQGFSLE
ncbi:MAG: glycosyl hydrolase [Lewinellaceae bacterium]|nr:glycosyl hydrolase [Lewinellaceae bacterium]